MKNQPGFTFEQGMEQLEKIVRGMETGELALEESFEAYKKGMELYKALTRMLDEGDARIRELSADAGARDVTEEMQP